MLAPEIREEAEREFEFAQPFKPPGVTPPAAPERPGVVVPTVEQYIQRLRAWSLETMWNDIRSNRSTGWWRRAVAEAPHRGVPAVLDVDPFVNREDPQIIPAIADALGIRPESILPFLYGTTPREIMLAQEAIWKTFFIPAAENMSRALDTLKPADLPGWMHIGWDPENEDYGILYLEAPYPVSGGWATYPSRPQMGGIFDVFKEPEEEEEEKKKKKPGLPARPGPPRPPAVFRPGEVAPPPPPAPPPGPMIFRPEEAAPPAPITPPAEELPAPADPFAIFRKEPTPPAPVRPEPKIFARPTPPPPPPAPAAPPPPPPTVFRPEEPAPPVPAAPPPPAEIFEPPPEPGPPAVVRPGPPTAEQIADFFRRNVDLSGVFKAARKYALDPGFIWEILRAQEVGDPDFGQIETLAFQYGPIAETYAKVLRKLAVPPGTIEAWIEPISKAEGRQQDPWPEFLELQQQFLEPLYRNATMAFETLKPPDIPGKIVIGELKDQVAVGYYEEPTPEMRQQYRATFEAKRREAKRRAEDARAQLMERLQGWSLKKGEWLNRVRAKRDELNLYGRAQDLKRTTPFQETLEEFDEGYGQIEAMASVGPDFTVERAGWLEIPPHVVDAFGQSPYNIDEELLNPMEEAVIQILNKEKPENLPGEFYIDWDFDRQNYGINYRELPEKEEPKSVPLNELLPEADLEKVMEVMQEVRDEDINPDEARDRIEKIARKKKNKKTLEEKGVLPEYLAAILVASAVRAIRPEAEEEAPTQIPPAAPPDLPEILPPEVMSHLFYTKETYQTIEPAETVRRRLIDLLEGHRELLVTAGWTPEEAADWVIEPPPPPEEEEEEEEEEEREEPEGPTLEELLPKKAVQKVVEVLGVYGAEEMTKAAAKKRLMQILGRYKRQVEGGIKAPLETVIDTMLEQAREEE